MNPKEMMSTPGSNDPASIGKKLAGMQLRHVQETEGVERSYYEYGADAFEKARVRTLAAMEKYGPAFDAKVNEGVGKNLRKVFPPNFERPDFSDLHAALEPLAPQFLEQAKEADRKIGFSTDRSNAMTYWDNMIHWGFGQGVKDFLRQRYGNDQIDYDYEEIHLRK